MEVLLEVLLRTVGEMSLRTAEPVFKPNVVIRGPERLPVEFTAR
ncbi:hypothetical protein [Nocardia sp. CC227C]|nr:hypothetical protein [Nocardia sp. CC227C]